ncbi:proline-rich protein HaeIII subfamily 1-like [Falco biarmicus]|uniref:proline-rich protein HaeIII subfamily 1-like n=1 Tax=Falco biarmicus TaxID=345155 RepID=UPI0024BD5552|nr:proline-rich protein HaeIII subfamily 1-like [Falco biarmicus]
METGRGACPAGSQSRRRLPGLAAPGRLCGASEVGANAGPAVRPFSIPAEPGSAPGVTQPPSPGAAAQGQLLHCSAGRETEEFPFLWQGKQLARARSGCGRPRKLQGPGVPRGTDGGRQAAERSPAVPPAGWQGRACQKPPRSEEPRRQCRLPDGPAGHRAGGGDTGRGGSLSPGPCLALAAAAPTPSRGPRSLSCFLPAQGLPFPRGSRLPGPGAPSPGQAAFPAPPARSRPPPTSGPEVRVQDGPAEPGSAERRWLPGGSLTPPGRRTWCRVKSTDKEPSTTPQPVPPARRT